MNRPRHLIWVDELVDDGYDPDCAATLVDGTTSRRQLAGRRQAHDDDCPRCEAHQERNPE